MRWVTSGRTYNALVLLGSPQTFGEQSQFACILQSVMALRSARQTESLSERLLSHPPGVFGFRRLLPPHDAFPLREKNGGRLYPPNSCSRGTTNRPSAQRCLPGSASCGRLTDTASRRSTQRAKSRIGVGASWRDNDHLVHGKAAVRFQPHCGRSRQLEIWRYSNLAGVQIVEHPVPKMDSVQLLEFRVERIAPGRTWHGSHSSPNAPGCRSNCGSERRECWARHCVDLRPAEKQKAPAEGGAAEAWLADNGAPRTHNTEPVD